MSNATPIEIRNQKLAKKVINNLQKRGFEAYYCPLPEEAAEKLFSLIPKTDVVSWGGSSTLTELKIFEQVYAREYAVIDRGKGKTPEEQQKLMREALLCDTYLMGSNALSENGELVNVDRTGNRVGALMYGPRQVIVVVGANKIVKSLEDAVGRARNTAAPINVQRFPDLGTPCSTTGACADCTHENCLCSHVVITRMCKPQGRIKVIIVGETMGY